MNFNDTKFTTIKYKFDRGLIPRSSDLYYIFSLLLEAQNEREELSHHERADGGTKESVRKASRGRPKKDGVRQGGSVRKTSSTSKDSAMEGDSKWEVKVEAVDQARPK